MALLFRANHKLQIDTHHFDRPPRKLCGCGQCPLSHDVAQIKKKKKTGSFHIVLAKRSVLVLPLTPKNSSKESVVPIWGSYLDF